jgi:catechol 2,3-dioxygenase-like lactoylglutathione lyase family enzyme
MIQRLSHATVWVKDQDSAKAFYVDKLGFRVVQDVTMGSFRWLTVSPPAQDDLDLILMPIAKTPMMAEADADVLRVLVEKGALGPGVLEVDDCQKTYDELKAKGVVFLGPPKQQPYGIETMMRDDSGNWFSVVERPR